MTKEFRENTHRINQIQFAMKYRSLLSLPTPVESRKPKDVFFAIIDGRQTGPMSESEMKVLVKNGSVSSSTLVWMPQLEQWTQAQFVPVVNKLLLLAQQLIKNQPSIIPQKEINPIRSDLINAIVGLGFKKSDAISAIDKVIFHLPNVTLENGIKEALKILK